MSPCRDGEAHGVENFTRKCLDERIRVARVRVTFVETAAGSVARVRVSSTAMARWMARR
jgi:hypothetical protein